MKIRSVIRQVGNSSVVTIPSQIMDQLKLKPTDYILIDFHDKKIIIEKDEVQH